MNTPLVPGINDGDTKNVPVQVPSAPPSPQPQLLPQQLPPQAPPPPPPYRRELGGPGLIPGIVHHVQNSATGHAQNLVDRAQKFIDKAPSVQYQQPAQPQYHQQPRYVQNVPSPQVAPSTGTSGLRIGAMGFSLASGLFPIPLNPLFFPIQMVAFIIIIIILLVNGWSFWTSALIAWIVPAMFAAVAHYMLIGSVLSLFGRGEDEKNAV